MWFRHLWFDEFNKSLLQKINQSKEKKCLIWSLIIIIIIGVRSDLTARFNIFQYQRSYVHNCLNYNYSIVDRAHLVMGRITGAEIGSSETSAKSERSVTSPSFLSLPSSFTIVSKVIVPVIPNISSSLFVLASPTPANLFNFSPASSFFMLIYQKYVRN